MRPVYKNVIGIFILSIIVLITIGVLFNNLTKKSFYEETGVIKVKGVSNRVNLYKSELGVTHIFAENESDMYFTLGFIHAQDRLWQMDISRRVAQGRLSEIFGKDVLSYDVLFRTIGINKVVSKFMERLSPKSKSILSSYCLGINYFIESNSSELPLEFDVLNYKPEPWKPEHSLMLIRLMGWELNLSWYSDVMFGEIVKKFGLEKAKDFFPDYPEDAPFIIKNENEKVKKNPDKNSLNLQNNKTGYELMENNYSKLQELGKNYFDLSKNFRSFYGLEGTHIGSNSWVVSGKKTESGKPMLANDAHLALMVPSKWYEVILYDNEKKYSVCGFSIPGIPAIAVGHNDVITWGITNLMCDDSDFYILKKDSVSNSKYIFKNEALALDSTLEVIKMKDVPDDFTFTSYWSSIGPVVSNLEITGFMNNQSFKTVSRDEILAFRWTGYEYSDELETFYKINNSSNWEDFQNALMTFGTPALNFIYADTSGNIAYHSAGLVPIRSNTSGNETANYPSGGEVTWSGFISFDELPSTHNPKEEYIVTANNKPLKNYKYYISNLYEPPYRAERIEQLLQTNPTVTEDEFKLMQKDVYSLQAKEYCGYLFQAFADTIALAGDIKKYLDQLIQWDYEFKVNSIPATLFAQFEIELYQNLYKTSLGDQLFEHYVFLKTIPVRNTAKLLKLNSSVLFENNFIKEEILRKSFLDAVSKLKEKYGSDLNTWQWGEVHKVYMKHPLGIFPSFTSMLNIGPFKIEGSGTTINNLEYNFFSALKNTEYESFLGPSMRMISDLSDIKTYFSIIPGGQSGQPLHRNYNDQARLWVNGNYKKVSTDFEILKNENLKLLTLEPSD